MSLIIISLSSSLLSFTVTFWGQGRKDLLRRGQLLTLLRIIVKMTVVKTVLVTDFWEATKNKFGWK